MTLDCPVCGGLLQDQVDGCGRCPVRGDCRMLCCPNCGYETVAPRSATLEFFKRLLRIRPKESRAS